MTDIIVRAKNGHELTARCLASIRANTKAPYRLILVDDGSDPAYAPTSADVVLRHPAPKGAVSATNTGLEFALQGRATTLAILDNDTEVPEGDLDWLDRWVAALNADSKNGAVGATSGFSSGPQHVLRSPQTYLADWGEGKGRKTNPWILTFVSFGVLLRTDAVRQCGLWDPRFDPGNFEDTDYGLTLRVNGWNVRVAQSVYLHHRGHQTFASDLSELLRVNNEKFIEKWGVGRLWDLGLVDDRQLLGLLQQRTAPHAN